MNLPIQILAKDLRRYWPLAAAATALIVFETLTPLRGSNVRLASFDVGEVLATFVKWPLIFILVFAVTQEDRTVGDRAFWRTRPIGAWAMLAGKLLFFTLVLTVPAVLASLRIASTLDTPARVTVGILIETTGLMLLAVLASALLASITGTIIQAALAAIGGLVVVAIVGAIREGLASTIVIRLPWDTDVAYPGGRVAFACVLACVALTALLAHQFITRRTGRTVGLLFVAAPLVLGASVIWSFDLSRPSRAAAFPDHPLAPSPNLAFTFETPARVFGNGWTFDAPARREVPEMGVTLYADLEGAIPGRYFEVVEAQSTLHLRDGRDIAFSPAPQWGNSEWNRIQFHDAICRSLGIPLPEIPPGPRSQGTVRIFNLPRAQLVSLGGSRGRLDTTIVLGESIFREDFRLPLHNHATRHEPGSSWELSSFAITDGHLEISLRYRRATTMLSAGGDSRPDVDPFPSDPRTYVVFNRQRGEYASGPLTYHQWLPGVVSLSRNFVRYESVLSADRTARGHPFDAAWLADAEFVVLRPERIGKTEKTVTVEDFEIPHS